MVQKHHSLRVLGTVAALILVVACSGRSQSAPTPAAPRAGPPPSSPSPPPASSPNSPSWLSVDSAARTVTLSLQVTAPAGAPSALINGYRAGEARLVVPLGWTVKWDWHSADSTAQHSLVVMVEREKMPLEGGRPAFMNAMTRMVTEGLAPGQRDQTTFLAEEAGWYWMLCGVPGHAVNGEWISLRVDPKARTATVQEKGVKSEE
jgi:hypothetical protein